MKKVMVILTMFTLLSAQVAHASFIDEFAEENGLDEASEYSDVSLGHPNLRAINYMSGVEVIQGYPDGTFRPDNPINRAELTKIAVEGSIGEDVVLDPEVYNNCFDDVTDDWYAVYVCYAYDQGWVQGYPDGTFKPANNVNRVEAMKILLEVAYPPAMWPEPTATDLAIPMPADLDMDQWYGSYMRFAIVKQLVDGQHVMQDPSGDLYYFPDGDMTRKEVVESLYRIAIYVVERGAYAQAMAELTCFQAYNEDYLETLSEDDKNKYLYFIFSLWSWDEDETTEILIKYLEDSAADAEMQYWIEATCGEDAEYDNWIIDSVDL